MKTDPELIALADAGGETGIGFVLLLHTIVWFCGTTLIATFAALYWRRMKRTKV
jgi:hypothetical protein